jgi:hypothetical protein
MAGTASKGRGQRATTAGGGAERTGGGNSDASSASGAPTCASHRRQRFPEQWARGAPTTAAVGYCSVLCENGTAALPDSNLPHHSAAGWHACNHERRGPCSVRHAARTSNRRCAANLVQTTRRMAQRGTQGVLKGYSRGTRILDRMHASTLIADHEPCCMRHARSTSDAQQASWQTTPDGTEGCSGILGCWTASMQRAQWLVQQ